MNLARAYKVYKRFRAPVLFSFSPLNAALPVCADTAQTEGKLAKLKK
jgi:hypothetical protein